MRKTVAIVGAGVSGLSCARLLQGTHDVTVFEKKSRPGGLIRCKHVQGSLFHMCGGHVFNTKNNDVANWFWSVFRKEEDFVTAERNSAVYLENGNFVKYPIEDHIYQLDAGTQAQIIDDWLQMVSGECHSNDFAGFLKGRFGKTLYSLYFEPYNKKIWRRDLSHIPLDWLQGKLPMPNVKEMLLANINRLDEKKFVHSSFYYPKRNGSQFIADTLSKGVKISYNAPILSIKPTRDGRLCLNDMIFDNVIYCGSVVDIPSIVSGIELGNFADEIAKLESHGTTSVFCEIESSPYSWFYQPSSKHNSHRVICTGNFSKNNNAKGKNTCTVEFTDKIDEDEIIKQLEMMPYNPKFLEKHYTEHTYPIQRPKTRSMIEALKRLLGGYGIRLVGRFAEWEYFNMDAAIESAMKCTACMRG